MDVPLGLNQRQGFDALSTIYDAAMERSLWPLALDAASAAIGARGSALMVTDAEEAPYSVQALSTAYDGLVAAGEVDYYMAHLAPLEVEEWAALARQQPRRIVADNEVGEAARLEQRADYVFLREKLGIRRRIGVRLNQNAAWYDAMTFCFDESLREVPNRARLALQPLLPHLSKAVAMARVFGRLRARYGAVLAVLDRVHVGLAVALESGELIVANSEAERIFAESDGLVRDRGNRLLCRDPDQMAMLEHAIRVAARTAAGEGDRAETLAVVRRPSGREPLLVEIAPLSDSADELAASLSGALVTLIDPENAPSFDITRFAALHGLTAAEANVCEQMVRGLTGTAIAERRSTSLQTVKSQMSRVLAKTGARRRSELIRLVVRTLPPIG